MTAQALAGAFAGLSIALAVLYSLLWHRWRRDVAELGETARRITRSLDDERKRHAVDLERRLAAGSRTRADVELERTLRFRAETRLEETELELARRRHGALVEGDTVALTTPDDRTIRGVVRQTFDNGAVLLGAAVVYVEERVHGEVIVRQEPAGDVAVPAHVWAQKLPPEPPANAQED